MVDYTLYSLLAKAGDDDEADLFSPHVWKTVLDLKHLGLSFTTVGTSFSQVSSKLSKQAGRTVQVPTIQRGEEYVTDSWLISEYLEKTHGTAERSLYGGSAAGKRFCKFIDLWTNTTFASEFRPLVFPVVYSIMDSTSQSAFMTGVWGDDTTKWKEATARLSDPEWLEERYEVVRTRLRLIESFLAASDGPFLLGEKVSHADFSVFGAYAWCRVNKEMAQAVWRHHSMPNLGKWLDAMLQGGLVETKRLKR